MLIAAMGVLFAGCTRGDSKENPSAPARPLHRVRVAAVETGPAHPAIVINGRLAPSSETQLSFRSEGRLRSVEVRPGERVHAGQILATLDSAELSAAIRKAREALEQSRRNRSRSEDLYARQLISRQALEDSRTSEAIAIADLNSTTHRSESALRAPSSGIVQQRLVEPGETVAPGQVVLVVSQHSNDRGDFVFRGGATEQEVIRVRLNDAVSLSFDSFPDKAFPGRVRDIGTTRDALSGGYEIAITLLEPAPRMVSGMIGKAEILPASGTQATRSYVPLTAIIEGTQHQAHLFVLMGDIAREQRVSIAFLRGDHAALTTPLPAGSRVITDGAEFLSDGQRVVTVD
jgi:RND family efflux transporter MFP subunit